ncbi:N-acetyl-galactosamine-6-sulfatase (GALNS) [Lentisphaera araneosa HTCC2155]|uniref:N-acetyl-galactosamine-6-sulfatase (GALNS) n=2 Tax=Lentisphaera TaxID=256846 RepID=A6DMW1_9BACT|nr:N-acetyl-galactosamine-6-sulfatase (GALNS) [Lentisphaera araneosa HTCC2155]
MPSALIAAKKPNVIVILIDDMGLMDSSTYGSKFYQTANMSRLAKEGMLFTDAYAASPLCSPTRASIMSGQYPSRLHMTVAVTPKSKEKPKALAPAPNQYCGKVESKNHMPLAVYTLAEALQDSGYTTAHIGKWHLTENPKHNAENQGFDFVIGGAGLPGPPDYYSPYKRKGKKAKGINNLSPGPKGEYLNERLAKESIKWIKSVQDSNKPFYLNLWHYAVHGPVIEKKDLMPKYLERRDPNNPQRCPEMGTMIDSMDNSVGMLLDWLDKPENKAVKDNTLIILTSDNGGVIHKETNGNTWTSNRPLRGGKANTYEGGTRVPWIVRWPDTIKAGSVCTTPVQSIDIYPTVLEAVNIKAKKGLTFDGQSILPLLEQRKMEHQPIFTDFQHLFGVMCAPSSSVRVGDMKLIRFYHAGPKAQSHAYELFDLKRDLYESINLAAYMPEKVKELDRLIEAHIKETAALVPIANKSFQKTASKIARSNPKKAALRPKTLALAETIIKTDSAGSQVIQLIDQNGKSRQTHALVLGGSKFVKVKNNEDGSVTVTWNKAPAGHSAKLLFGWKGGADCFEINDWTIPPCELLIKAH